MSKIPAGGYQGSINVNRILYVLDSSCIGLYRALFVAGNPLAKRPNGRR
jgi:hypothetical protein